MISGGSPPKCYGRDAENSLLSNVFLPFLFLVPFPRSRPISFLSIYHDAFMNILTEDN